MSAIQRIFWGHMLVATGGLAVGYAMAPLIVEANWGIFTLIFVFIGGLWFAAQQRGAIGLEGIILYLYVLAAGLGFLLGAPGWLMLFSGVATLGAWDLDHFLQRLKEADNVDYSSGVGQNHIRRLGLVEGVGLLVGLTAITLRTSVSFWWEVALAFVALLGVRALIDFVRKQSE